MSNFFKAFSRVFRQHQKMEPPAIDPSITETLSSDTSREEVLQLLGLPKSVLSFTVSQSGSLDVDMSEAVGYGLDPSAAAMTYEGQGEYNIVLANAFPVGTKIYIQNGGSVGTPGGLVMAERMDDTRIKVITQDITGAEANDILVNASVLIEVPFP